ncbi:unnamed protein product [Owenia fusiformis]|uniref:Uncharacterized protein n=1 Tax=Owenia fusiformis TaxID=6347 RepID=A0A8J1TD98_OWEFU|nr:unnamed protein product [Owenia fusiformis]
MGKQEKKEKTWTKNEVFAQLKNKGEKAKLKKDLIDLTISQKVTRFRKTDELKDLKDWVKTIRQTTGHSACGIPTADSLDNPKRRCKSAFPGVSAASAYNHDINPNRGNILRRQTHQKLHVSSAKSIRPKSMTKEKILQHYAEMRSVPAYQLFTMEKMAKEEEGEMTEPVGNNDSLTFEETYDIWKRSVVKMKKAKKSCEVHSDPNIVDNGLTVPKSRTPLKTTDNSKTITIDEENEIETSNNGKEPLTIGLKASGKPLPTPLPGDVSQGDKMGDTSLSHANDTCTDSENTKTKSKWTDIRNKVEKDIFDKKYEYTNSKLQPKVLPQLHQIVSGIIHNKTSQTFLKRFDGESDQDDVSECESVLSDLHSGELQNQKEKLAKIEYDSTGGKSTLSASDDICMNPGTHPSTRETIRCDPSTALPPNELTSATSQLRISSVLCNSQLNEQPRPISPDIAIYNNNISLGFVSNSPELDRSCPTLPSSYVNYPDKNPSSTASRSPWSRLALYSKCLQVATNKNTTGDRNSKKTDDVRLELLQNAHAHQLDKHSRNGRPSTPLFFAEQHRNERIAAQQAGKVDFKTLRARRVAIERPVGLMGNRGEHFVKLNTGMTKAAIKQELKKLVATNDENKMSVAERERLKIIQSKIRMWLATMASDKYSG